MRFQDMSRELRMQWAHRMRKEWNLPIPTIIELISGTDTPSPGENRYGRLLDWENGHAATVSPGGHISHFRYNPEKARRSEPSFLHWVED